MPGTRSEKNKKHESSQDSNRPKVLSSNHTHYSTTDPDARIAVKPGKPIQLDFIWCILVLHTSHHATTHIHAYFADCKVSMRLGNKSLKGSKKISEPEGNLSS